MNLEKANKGEIYQVLQSQDLSTSLQTKNIGAKKCWLATFTRANLPIERLQAHEDDLSSKFESILYRKKKKSGKSKVHAQGKSHHLAKLQNRRKRKLFSVPTDVKYNMFVPLREMWTKYVEDLIQFSSLKDSSLPSAAQKLMKADFHGCPITVTQSKCPSYIGVHGIVIKETKNTFVIVLQDDTVKCIPKANSIFSIIVHDYAFTIYGNQFTIKPGERAGKKFKSKPTIDL